jgi:ABC-2 type transport system permease protein/lipopolysaccharide transport system permease protein
LSTTVEAVSGENVGSGDDSGSGEGGALKVFDVSLVPEDPPDDQLYKHKPDMLHSARELFSRWDVMFTLAERDIRAQYKQAVLGVAWALLVPLVSLLMLVILAGHLSGFSPGGHIPFPLWTYTGLLAWGLFGGAIGGGTNALVSNKALMAKSHFPRECFPLAQVLESAFSSLIALVPLVVLFACYGFRYPPQLTTLWSPLYLAVEIPFMLGLVFLVSSVIVTMRDLQQIVPILMPLVMLITVLKPLAVERHHQLTASFITDPVLRFLYCVANPMAAVLSNFRDSVLLGFGPQWEILIAGAIGSVAYLVLGYVVFKRLEVNFADLT